MIDEPDWWKTLAGRKSWSPTMDNRTQLQEELKQAELELSKVLACLCDPRNDNPTEETLTQHLDLVIEIQRLRDRLKGGELEDARLKSLSISQSFRDGMLTDEERRLLLAQKEELHIAIRALKKRRIGNPF